MKLEAKKNLKGMDATSGVACGQDRQAELSNCTFVKTVLMLIVVIYHCVLYWDGGWFVGTPAFSAPSFPLLPGG